MTNNAIGYMASRRPERALVPLSWKSFVCFCGHAPQIKKIKQKKKKKKKKNTHGVFQSAEGKKKDRAPWKNLFQRDSTFWMARSLDGYGNGIKCYSKQFYGQYFFLGIYCLWSYTVHAVE